MKVPSDEMFLAKLIQNAKAAGLYACRLTNFRDRWKHHLEGYDPTKVASCCAFGAALIEPDTAEMRTHSSKVLALQFGNDRFAQGEVKSSWAKGDWFEVGQAFYDACRKTRRKRSS